MNIAKRFKNIRLILKKSQDELASECEMTKQAISNIENSKSMPSLNVLNILLTKYNVNLNYLISGSGELFNSEEKNQKNLKNMLIEEIEHFFDVHGIN